MEKYSNDLAAIVTLEAGKPFSEAKGTNTNTATTITIINTITITIGEIAYARSFIEFYAEEAKRIKGNPYYYYYSSSSSYYYHLKSIILLSFRY